LQAELSVGFGAVAAVGAAMVGPEFPGSYEQRIVLAFTGAEACEDGAHGGFASGDFGLIAESEQRDHVAFENCGLHERTNGKAVRILAGPGEDDAGRVGDRDEFGLADALQERGELSELGFEVGDDARVFDEGNAVSVFAEEQIGFAGALGIGGWVGWRQHAGGALDGELPVGRIAQAEAGGVLECFPICGRSRGVG